MSKKRKKSQTNKLSPEKFVMQRMRSLEIGQCFINRNDDCGEHILIITRCHKAGGYSVGVFLLDVFCLGIKDTYYLFNIDSYKYADLVENANFETISYNEAHNLIYGAIEFAEEAGISPHRDFRVTKYFLAEDNDEIPLIEYDYGKDGKHFLVVNTKLELNKYLPLLESHLSADEFDYMIELDEEEDDFSFIDENSTQYTYERPMYPTKLVLENAEVKKSLEDSSYSKGFTDDAVNTLLQIEKDSLRKDLENFIMYYLGISRDNCECEVALNYNDANAIVNALLMLGEVGDENSLAVVFEVLRQPEDFYEFNFSDGAVFVFPGVLTKLGKESLDKMLSFAKEEGLYTYAHNCVFSALKNIAVFYPEKRDEVVAYFDEILDFALEKLPNIQYFDRTLLGFIVCEVCELKAIELLDKIEKLFATKMVDITVCGDYQSVKADIQDDNVTFCETSEIDIYKQFEIIRKNW